MRKTPILNKKFVSIMLVLLVMIGGFVTIVPRLTGAQQCTSVEKYDFIRDECYFECDSQRQCDALSQKVDEELSASFSATQTKATTSKPTSPRNSDDGQLYTIQSTGSETNGTVYTVQNSDLQPSPSQNDEKLWNLVVALLGTQNVQKHIVSFEVFNEENNDTAASVWRSDSNASQWHMNINSAFATQDKKDLIRTVVHEYGHIITLSGDQVVGVSGACPRIQLDEGCGNDDSYINAYYNQFWKNYGFEASSVGSISEDDAAELYNMEPKSFVSDYASTNITEDIAESFADFVTKSKPSGTEVMDQKVQFFYQYPSLVSLREQIRVAIAKEIYQ
jgi:hypothetical protein